MVGDISVMLPMIPMTPMILCVQIMTLLLPCVQIELEEKMDVQSKLDVFHVDPEFEAHEAEWAAIKKELLGEESDDGDGGDGDGSGDESSDDDSDEEGALPPPPGKETQVRQLTIVVFLFLPMFASFSFLAFFCCVSVRTCWLPACAHFVCLLNHDGLANAGLPNTPSNTFLHARMFRC